MRSELGRLEASFCGVASKTAAPPAHRAVDADALLSESESDSASVRSPWVGEGPWLASREKKRAVGYLSPAPDARFSTRPRLLSQRHVAIARALADACYRSPCECPSSSHRPSCQPTQ